MVKIVALLLVSISMENAKAQNTLKTIIKDIETNEPLMGVTLRLQTKITAAVSGNQGFAELKNIPDGKQIIVFSHSGYKVLVDSFNFPLVSADTMEISMEIDNKELNEVIVESTRTSRTIKNTPTRIETIDGEELEEKNNMRPANVSMLLHESTGLHVQQTSATSGNASIRVQGLDGRYTQLLKDGYPNFENFANGLSILEIPPLDLKQIEVIKGPASTLYGGGAIAGVINFISKSPGEKFEGDFIINQSNIGQTNLGGYISQKSRKSAYSVLGLFNIQKPYDVDKDDFSEIPKSNNFTINPTFYLYFDSSATLRIANSFTKGTNTGGDMHVINGIPGAGHTYSEKNNTIRNTSTLEFDKKLAYKSSLKLKQSVGIFDRHINVPDHNFPGVNINCFTDLSLVFFRQKHTMIGGLNVVFEKFRQENSSVQNTQSFATGGYFQDTWDIEEGVKIESGIRLDNVQYKNINYHKNQTFFLPRLSVLFKLNDKISSRIGGGLGYKIPTIFTEQTESMQYQNILPLDKVEAERSIGGTADLTYKTGIPNGLSFSFNQMFFYTNIHNPLVLQTANSGSYYFINASKAIISKGSETNLKFIFKRKLKLFVGYTFTNAKATYLTTNSFLPLLPKSKLNMALMYEKEDNFKLGFEGYFTGRQYLYDGTKTPSFWEFGFMCQKTFGKISLFVNFENFTDERQSKYKTVVNPPRSKPVFDDIWNHTEGFVVNGGMKLKF